MGREVRDWLRGASRAGAAGWRGVSHAGARSPAARARLPDAGPSRYRAAMRATRDLIRDQINNPAFSADDVAFLDGLVARFDELDEDWDRDRKSTRLNSSHGYISYAVFCLKKKKNISYWTAVITYDD